VSAVSPDCEDRDHQRARVRHRLAVAVFARDLDRAWNAGDAFQPIARHHPRVVARAARENQGRIHALKRFFVANLLLQSRVHRRRLLEDLLLHVVPVAAELDRVRAELAHVQRPLHHVAARVHDAQRFERELGAVAFFEVHDVARDLEQGGSIGGREVLVLADAEQQRRAHAGDDQARGVVRADHRNRERAFELPRGQLNGAKEIFLFEGMN
jgi:hypothetical protein